LAKFQWVVLGARIAGVIPKVRRLLFITKRHENNWKFTITMTECVREMLYHKRFRIFFRYLGRETHRVTLVGHIRASSRPDRVQIRSGTKRKTHDFTSPLRVLPSGCSPCISERYVLQMPLQTFRSCLNPIISVVCSTSLLVPNLP